MAADTAESVADLGVHTAGDLNTVAAVVAAVLAAAAAGVVVSVVW